MVGNMDTELNERYLNDQSGNGSVMAKVIEAVYENGVFKPLEKPNLKEGEKVKIRVERSLIEVVREYQKAFKLSEKDVEEFLRERR